MVVVAEVVVVVVIVVVIVVYKNNKNTQKWKWNMLKTKPVYVTITKQQYTWSTGTKAQHPRNNGQLGSRGFPKDVNIFAHQVNSQNVCRRQRVFTSNIKHGGPQIIRKLWYHIYPNEMGISSTWTDDDKLSIAWENNVCAKQPNQLHWFNVSVTSVTNYKKIMLQYRLICKPHTYRRLRLKSFCRSFPVTINKNYMWQWSVQTLLAYSPPRWKHLDVENAFAIPWPYGGKVTTSVARNTLPSSTPSDSSVWMK
jgi:hypothetical protein